jgi:hypothetical protein
METFTVVIKSVHNADRTRTVKIKAEDTWLAHKEALSKYNEFREIMATIKDSKGNEVFNLEKGFLFES